ncbi:BREX-2 system phosphatase PglZ [Lyngbya confervoides]|uniref:BREX-2 system phosphatase PglZ n=1 Tax=Lyngbya confervoides BDU141951 TaxID=1574623 RepID=A0ABD4T745_9CYAN|nr:BREX-2 system phosphatase PglZ [Lyngbya confervoides]MCM1984070.1 BREX-2 system phosphatase PglZ [Lyngbya confervoides BDU141951]
MTAILQRSPDSKIIGIHAKGRWTGNRQQHDGERCYQIEQCDSPLAIRLAIQQFERQRLQEETPHETVQVFVTPMEETDLSEDILLRLAKQRLFIIDPWQIVKSLFRATNIDPRLLEHPWIPELLMDWMPNYRHAPVLGGFLDAEVIWPLFLQHGLYFKSDRLDLVALLQWSMVPEHIEQYQQCSEPFRNAACDWLSQRIGKSAEIILHCVEQSSQPDALPLGLALQVLCHPDVQNKLDKSMGKVEERFLAGKTPSMGVLEMWRDAAQQAARQCSAAIQQYLIQRSDAILTDIGAELYAHLSESSELGLNQRLLEFSNRLDSLIKKPTESHQFALQQAFNNLKTHQAIEHGSRRLQRLEMAIRLAQWIVKTALNPADPAPSLEDAIASYMNCGSYLDWARYSLRLAEPCRELASAYGRLFKHITALREEQNHRFAELLAQWTEFDSERSGIIPVEKILERVVSPLAEKQSVLLILIDGMSIPVAHELISHCISKGWQLTSNGHCHHTPQAGLATIPSITSFSRASLLAGRLTNGQQSLETKEFANHIALLKVCKKTSPPLLFHKDSLQTNKSPIIPDEIAFSISSSKNRIIGVVINAVDDLLNKGDQVDITWDIERIKVLLPLLEMARDSKRLVILTSDHGHILENASKYEQGNGAERWRLADRPAKDQEIKIRGPRVQEKSNFEVIVPWTETLRYCRNKKNGYHGGCCPQEMIVPIAVLTSQDIPVDTSNLPQQIYHPEWWSIQSTQSTRVNSGMDTCVKTSQSLNNNFGSLFTP